MGNPALIFLSFLILISVEGSFLAHGVTVPTKTNMSLMCTIVLYAGLDP